MLWYSVVSPVSPLKNTVWFRARMTSEDQSVVLRVPGVRPEKCCEGVAVSDGEHLMIADDAATFASRIVEVFENPGLGDALGQAGRCLVERSYSWELAGERLESLYRQITDSEPGRSMKPELLAVEA